MQNNKRRLLLSVVSMLVVLTMVAGMTMAWFSDVEKANANFSAGTLDLALTDGTNALVNIDIDEAKPASDAAIAAQIAALAADQPLDPTSGVFVQKLSVENLGSLPFAVKMAVNAANPCADTLALVPNTNDNGGVQAATTADAIACANQLTDVIKIELYDETGKLVYDLGAADFDIGIMASGASNDYILVAYLPATVPNYATAADGTVSMYNGAHFHGTISATAVQSEGNGSTPAPAPANFTLTYDNGLPIANAKVEYSVTPAISTFSIAPGGKSVATTDANGRVLLAAKSGDAVDMTVTTPSGASFVASIVMGETDAVEVPVANVEYGKIALDFDLKLCYSKAPYTNDNKILRVAATDGEKRAANLIADDMKVVGLTPEIVPFTYSGKTSQNVVAKKLASKTTPGQENKLIILGTHYDAVKAGGGFGDNGSGVGVFMEAVARLANEELDYDLWFVAFGAEEVGLRGSNAFAQAMSEADRARCVTMVNLDSVVCGDQIYVNAGHADKVWARDQILAIAAEDERIPLIIQPGKATADKNMKVAGLVTHTSGISDFAAFNKIGVPIAYLEATNYDLGTFDGYTQTTKGSYWHTAKDNYSVYEADFPGRVDLRFEQFSTVICEFLGQSMADAPLDYAPIN